jgi:hypothetical protein
MILVNATCGNAKNESINHVITPWSWKHIQNID